MIQTEFTKQLSLVCLRRENPYDGLTVILPINTRGPVACSDNYRQRTSPKCDQVCTFCPAEHRSHSDDNIKLSTITNGSIIFDVSVAQSF